MKCNDAVDLLPLYVGDDLGNDTVALQLASNLEQHLDSCKLCEAEYLVFADARQALLDAEDSLGSATYQSVWHDISVQLPQLSPWRRVFKLSAGLIAASLLVMVVAQNAQQLALEPNAGVAVVDSHLTSNLEDLQPPIPFSVPAASRKMSQQEVHAFFAEQRKLENSQFFEQSFVAPLGNQQLPAASLVGLEYPTRRAL
ncbi:MAG: zf-HC2 domain-containing protein [Planctomycetes bacterium]|nr:zf-HC2 domain-containing protein [Planctomycetota bacterium]